MDAPHRGEAADEWSEGAQLFMLPDEHDGERGVVVCGESGGDERGAIGAFVDGVEVAADDTGVAGLSERACLGNSAKCLFRRNRAGEFDVEQGPFGVDANDIHRQSLEPTAAKRRERCSASLARKGEGWEVGKP